MALIKTKWSHKDQRSKVKIRNFTYQTAEKAHEHRAAHAALMLMGTFHYIWSTTPQYSWNFFWLLYAVLNAKQILRAWNPYCCFLKDHTVSVHCHLPICSGQNLIPEQVEQIIRNTGDQKINFIFTKVPMWKHTAMGIVFKLFGKVLAGTSLFIKIHYFFSRGCAWFHIPLHHNMDVSGYMSAIPPWK